MSVNKHRNDPIKHPAFFKRPPPISTQVIFLKFNKRPALFKRFPRLSAPPPSLEGTFKRKLS